MPNTNKGYWEPKILRNQERDKEVQVKLADMGWHCITIWECELRPEHRESTLQSLIYTLNHIFLKDHTVRKIYDFDQDEELSYVAEDPLQ